MYFLISPFFFRTTSAASENAIRVYESVTMTADLNPGDSGVCKYMAIYCRICYFVYFMELNILWK